MPVITVSLDVSLCRWDRTTAGPSSCCHSDRAGTTQVRQAGPRPLRARARPLQRHPQAKHWKIQQFRLLIRVNRTHTHTLPAKVHVCRLTKLLLFLFLIWGDIPCFWPSHMYFGFIFCLPFVESLLVQSCSHADGQLWFLTESVLFSRL